MTLLIDSVTCPCGHQYHRPPEKAQRLARWNQLPSLVAEHRGHHRCPQGHTRSITIFKESWT